jgi:hypothetical protein
MFQKPALSSIEGFNRFAPFKKFKDRNRHRYQAAIDK